MVIKGASIITKTIVEQEQTEESDAAGVYRCMFLVQYTLNGMMVRTASLS